MLEALCGVLMSIVSALGGPSPLHHDWETEAYKDLDKAAALITKYDEAIGKIDYNLEAIAMAISDVDAMLANHELSDDELAKLQMDKLKLETKFWQWQAKKNKYLRAMKHQQWRIEMIRDVWDMD